MAQEVPVAAAAEAMESPTPSPKRRNRKKGRQTEDGGLEAAVSPLADVATADLISLPSPVASVTTDAFGAAEQTQVQQALGGLSLTLDETPIAVNAGAETEAPQLDGLSQLRLQQSSRRLPLTPPPTPEPFLVHSPEKSYPRVSPMSSGLQLPPVAGEGQENAVTAEMLGAIEEQAEVEEAAATVEPLQIENDVSTVETSEQVASTLSNNLADLNLTTGSVAMSESIEPGVPVEKATDQPNAEQSADTQPVATPVEAVHSIPSPVAEKVTLCTPVVEEPVEAALTSTESVDAASVSLPEAVQVFEEREAILSAAVEEVNISEPVPVPAEAHGQTKTEGSAAGIPKDASKASSELPQSQQCSKTKGDIPERKPHLKPATASAPKIQPVKQSLSVADAKSAHTSKQEAPKPSLEAHAQPRRAKRKGDDSDVKPPPAPVVAAAAKDAVTKRLIARSHSGSSLKRTETNLERSEAKAKPATVAHSTRDPKNDSMMNPTASSMARATAAEGRKALLKRSAAKKAPVRKVMRSKVPPKPVAPQQEAVPGPPGPPDQENTASAPPSTADHDHQDFSAAEDDSLRNVKRRLNASDAKAASNRLYEDAKEAKLRKDARRAELQETYSFAPQVNIFKRRNSTGESETADKDHFVRLHAQAKELLERKRELQLQHEKDGCTFAPTISARAKRLPQRSTGTRYEHLYKHAQELKQKREEKLLEKAKTTDEECPFKPKITVSKSPVKTRPLYDSEREKQKRLALEQKKIEAEMSECTFKPKVSAKRLKSKPEDSPAGATTDAMVDANPYNRLYQASIQRTERLEKLRQEREEEEKSQAPFQPKITARSRATKDRAKSKQPFHKRLYNKDYLQKLDAVREQRKLQGEQQYTFKPEINEPPEEIKTKVKERADSPGKSIYERLYEEKDKMKEKIEMGEELRLQKEMSECTFRPQIEVEAVVQSNGEPAPPVWERLLNYDKVQVIEEREKLKEQLEMQECTFKPEVKSPDGPAMKRNSSYSVFDRLNGSGSNSPVSPMRASFVTRRPSSSPGRPSPDTKGVSIGRIIKLTKFSLPTERKTPSRAYSISQPPSVNKHVLKRATSFSGPKSASSSPTTTAGNAALDGNPCQTGASQDAEAVNGNPTVVLENYESWSATLEAKMRNLREQ